MITKETARLIYNCYQQLEEIEKIKKEMLEEIKKQEEQRKNSEPIPEGSFGKFGKGMQLGVPDGFSTSMRIFNISPDIAIHVMDEQKKALEEQLEHLKTLAKLELN